MALSFTRRSAETAATRTADAAKGGSIVMLPFSPALFFADKNRAFWRLQLVGWGGSALLRATTNIANNAPDKLVLTLIDFLRRLFEKQAIRRMEEGSLTAQETESLGLALMRLEETITELAARFDLSPEDLNLDLGPLGRLRQ